MATTYVADPTAADTPSVAPDEDDVPSSLIPVDGDPPNAATWAQALKVTPDWVAWLKKPFAKASAWAQAVMKWQNALKQDRFLIDHAGFPGGRVRQITEWWRGAESQIGPGTVQFTSTNLIWTTFVVSAGAGTGGFAVSGPDPATINERHLAVTLDTAGSDESLAISEALVAPGAANCIVAEWDVFLGAGVNQQRMATGLAKQLSHAFGDDSIFLGAVFFIQDGSAQWWCNIGDGTTLGTPFATSVALNTNTLFQLRIEWWGASVADDSAASLRFYINGALVKTYTAGLPAPDVIGSDLCASVVTKRTAGSTARAFAVSPMRITYNY